MSMNQYMHPRNIYKQPPNFKQLAIDYPEFRKYATQDISGKITVDFKNIEALRALTCTLLKKDFNLDIQIPPNKLIPTIPLRLNYILWIEDLLNLMGITESVKGIDIGTGASCVYPTIGAKKNKWFMLATEIDEESIKFATENVAKNSLESLIKVVKVDKNTLIAEVVGVDDCYDFCMCNPPFFSSAQELHPFFKARKHNRSHPRNAFCASVDEVVSKGGEVEYITKLINESKTLGTRIKIYSTMVGHKSSLPALKKLLRDVDVLSFKQTEFCQGHTTRWGLAWTFVDVDLTKIPESLVAAKQKAAKPILYEVPKIDSLPYKMNYVMERLLHIFNELQMDYQEVKHISNLVEYIITAYANTWSHQRRKRREKMRLNGSGNGSENNNDSLNSSGESSEMHTTCDKLSELTCSGSTKRSHEEDGFYNSKKIKIGMDSSIPSKIYLKAKVSIVKIDSSIALELIFFEGSGTKEALHQVLQYIKNNLLKS